MRHAIYQGESTRFVIRTRFDLTDDSVVEAVIVDPTARIAARFSTGAKEERERIVAVNSRLLTFGLAPEQTARMLGRYRIEIRAVCGDTTMIRPGWTLCVHRSVLAGSND